MHLSRSTFDTIFQESGLITKDDLILVHTEAEKQGVSPLDTLISLGKMSETHIAEILSKYYDVPIIDVAHIGLTEETLTKISDTHMKAMRIALIQYREEEHTAILGMVDPGDYGAISFVEHMLNVHVEPAVITPSSLQYALRAYKKAIGVGLFIDEDEDTLSEDVLGGDGVAEKLDKIIEYAITLGASDIHFEVLEHGLEVRFRIDGLMQNIASFPKEYEAPLVARVKVLAGMRIDEHSAPQDGRFRASQDAGGTVDVRVNVMPTFHGEKVEMRLLVGSQRPIIFRELGLSQTQETNLEEETAKPNGMILVTGPTGHGKTTTLYAILHKLNTPKVNITTIEDPIEYEFPHVNQTQVNKKAGITFANGLRSLLRQNPDIIMVGEIRDEETVDISVHAALTGHLLLSSLHTNDAPSAIPRLIDMGAEPFLLSSIINAIVAQRLVRKVCTSCIYSYKTPADVEKAIKTQIKKLGDKHIRSVPKTLYKGRGCPVCGGSGFTGQIGIFEILEMNDAVRELILAKAPASKIRAQAIKDGMETLFEDGLKKIEQGTTTIEEVLRVVNE